MKLKYLLILCIFCPFAVFAQSTERLLIFAGSASKPATELAAEAFTAKTGAEVDLIFGGAGYVLSQMQLGRTGDIYFPGTSDYMDTALEKELVLPHTVKDIAYLVNVINVRKGNPHQITQLSDLAKPGLRIAIGNPNAVAVGLYAVEIIEQNLNPEQIEKLRSNIVHYPESAVKTVTALSLGTVDAVVGWHVFEHWDSSRIETIKLKAEQIIRVGCMPIAVSTFSQNPELASEFIDFISTGAGQKFYRDNHLFVTTEDVASFIGEEKPIGGNYALPQTWRHE